MAPAYSAIFVEAIVAQLDKVKLTAQESTFTNKKLHRKFQDLQVDQYSSGGVVEAKATVCISLYELLCYRLVLICGSSDK